MATPARRRRGQTSPIPAVFFIVVIGVVLFCVAMAWLVTHPVVLVLALLGGGTAAGIDIKRRIDRREQQRIQAAQQAAIQEARSREIATYHQMSPREFEEAVAYLCQRDGCTQVQVVGGRGDLGADVKAIAPDGRRIVIQCKRYGPTTKVGSQDMQRFGGTCYAVHQADVAALVTTSVFTKDAAAYGAGMRIGRFDADMLAGWASRTGPAPWQ